MVTPAAAAQVPAKQVVHDEKGELNVETAAQFEQAIYGENEVCHTVRLVQEAPAAEI